jgi:hypothetical protein
MAINPEDILSHLANIPGPSVNGEASSGPKTGREILAEAKFDPRAPRKPKKWCITFEKDGQVRRFGTMGNMSLIIGKAKSKKTFLVSMITAAAIRNGLLQNTIRCSFPDEKSRIVYFETEQDNEDLGTVVDRAFTLAGGNAELLDYKIDIFNLSVYHPADKIKAIGDYLEDNKDVGLVVLDGCRDITYDINDSSQAMTAITTMISWTRQHNVHLMTVLHQNKGDDNARGHLGTECINRCETSVDVSRDSYDKSVSLVNPKMCRGMEFEPFYFAVDDNGLPQVLNSFVSGEKRASKVTTPSEIDSGIHQSMLRDIFKNNTEMTQQEFCSAIRVGIGGMGIKLGDHASRDYATYYKNNGWVDTKPGSRKTTLYFLSMNSENKIPF